MSVRNDAERFGPNPGTSPATVLPLIAQIKWKNFTRLHELNATFCVLFQKFVPFSLFAFVVFQ